MGKFLVCRLDAVRPNHRMKTSDLWPTIVETDPDGPVMTYEDIVKEAFKFWGSDYIGYHKYIVVSLSDAQIIEFKKRHDYEVVQRRFTEERGY